MSIVRALEATQRFKVLSRPAIYAANNKKAVITSGHRIPVPTSSITDLSNTSNVRTNITYQDVVLKLEVIPLINSNKEVSLTIAQVNDTVDGQQQVADNTVPIIGTERLVTTVTVANRTTIVLGGLITENEEKSTSGIPVLSRIPVLGNAFKSTKTKKSRKELLIFIQPVVVEDDEAGRGCQRERRPPHPDRSRCREHLPGSPPHRHRHPALPHEDPDPEPSRRRTPAARRARRRVAATTPSPLHPAPLPQPDEFVRPQDTTTPRPRPPSRSAAKPSESLAQLLASAARRAGCRDASAVTEALATAARTGVRGLDALLDAEVIANEAVFFPGAR